MLLCLHLFFIAADAEYDSDDDVVIGKLDTYVRGLCNIAITMYIVNPIQFALLYKAPWSLELVVF